MVTKEEIECDGIVWKTGNTSHHERGGLGDKSIRGKVNQRESGKATD